MQRPLRRRPVVPELLPERSVEPLSAAAFATFMQGLVPPGAPVAVALSGGADSLALTLLAAAWARAEGRALVALSVDHDLRDESAAELQQVATWMAHHDISHQILRWDGPKPTTGLQQAAREARYGLLEGWCRAHGTDHLLLGHHQDDQAETFLMRLQRGSGLFGLSAMRPITHGRIKRVRPLLKVPKARLVATLHARGQDWIEDPSNDDDRFTRVRLRRQLERGAFSAAALAQSADRLGQVRNALEVQMRALLEAALHITDWGGTELDIASIKDAADEVRLRSLGQVLRAVGGRPYAPSMVQLEGCWDTLMSEKAQTLSHCQIQRQAGVLRISREDRHLPDPTVLGPEPMIWDRRIVLSSSQPGLRIAPLGRHGRLQCLSALRGHVPATAQAALPAIWQGSELVCVPGLCGTLPAGARFEWLVGERIFALASGLV